MESARTYSEHSAVKEKDGDPILGYSLCGLQRVKSEDFTDNRIESILQLPQVAPAGHVGTKNLVGREDLRERWEKHYYVTSAVQNFFGCTSPSAQQVSLPDLAVGPDYHITWFPTRMNDTIHPVNAVDTTGTGTVLLDMGTAPLGDTAYKYLDTLHLDYGFIISLAPVHRNMIVPAEADLPPSTGWDFGLYPNPAQNRLNVVLPDEAARDITIYDLSGRQVYHKSQAEGPLIIIQTERFSRGTYCIRVSDVVVVRNKLLIIQ